MKNKLITLLYTFVKPDLMPLFWIPQMQQEIPFPCAAQGPG